MLVIGVLVTIGFWIIDLPFALTLGIITALLSFIPFIGPFLSYIPAVLVALLESPMQVLYVSIVYFAIQILESYFITPNIEHKAVFIPPALLISMQILMGALMGIMGVLFATPLAVVFIILIQMLYVRDVLGDSIKILGKREKKVKENGMV
jgi:predicted PurR-regulated permease PerM